MKVSDTTHPRIVINHVDGMFFFKSNEFIFGCSGNDWVISEHFPVDCLLLQASCSEPSK